MRVLHTVVTFSLLDKPQAIFPRYSSSINHPRPQHWLSLAPELILSGWKDPTIIDGQWLLQDVYISAACKAVADKSRCYEQGLFTDLLLVCEGRDFRVHKTILACDSWKRDGSTNISNSWLNDQDIAFLSCRRNLLVVDMTLKSQRNSQLGFKW